MKKKNIEANPVDEKLQEKMAQKLDKDFDGNDWYGATLDTKSDPIADPGTGKALVIRSFDFKINKSVRGFPTSKQELFNTHAKQIQTLLWADGLRPYEGVDPKMTIDATRGTYRIVLVAEPRLGVTVMETPSSLNKLLNQRNGRV